MALDKDTLKTNLKTWMSKGAAGDFTTMALGIAYFMGLVASYGSEGQDSYGNNPIGYTALPLQTALATLSPTDTTDIPAAQLAIGAINSWDGKDLENTNTPLSYSSTTSHNIKTLPTFTDIKDKFKAILDLDLNAYLDLLPPEVDGKVVLRNYLAGLWADALEQTATDCVWEWKYNDATPSPAGPIPQTESGNIS